MNRLTTIDLFCGAGGISEGLRQAGFECVFGNDIDEDSISTFQRNHPGVATSSEPVDELDARHIRRSLGLGRGELDCLAGGPPCQGFSINAPERFLADPRNKLFANYLDFVAEFRPKTILFENVPGMLSLARGLVVRQVTHSLANLAYDVSMRVLFAAHYGVPQERYRLFILASRVGPAPRHPEPTHYANGRPNFTGGSSLVFRLSEALARHLHPHVSVQEAIGDLPKLRAGEGSEETEYSTAPHSPYARKMRKGSQRLVHHAAPNIARVNLERLRHIPPGGSWRDIPRDLLPEGMKRARTSDHTRRYGRLTADGLSGTVMTKMDPHWGPAFHYNQERTLTVREAARLQSFPDSYTFAGPKVSQYRQVGNAVPVLMTRAIGDSLREAIMRPGQISIDSTNGPVQLRLSEIAVPASN